MKLIDGRQIILDAEVTNPIKVSINQFNSIEINNFTIIVTKVALWIAESQMLEETEDIIYTNLKFLPIESGSMIIEGNRLRMD